MRASQGLQEGGGVSKISWTSHATKRLLPCAIYVAKLFRRLFDVVHFLEFIPSLLFLMCLSDGRPSSMERLALYLALIFETASIPGLNR